MDIKIRLNNEVIGRYQEYLIIATYMNYKFLKVITINQETGDMY